MVGGDPDPQRRGPDHELERRREIDCLAVNPGVDRLGSVDFDRPRAPRSSGPTPGVALWVQNDDPEPAAVEGWAGAGHDRTIQRVGVVGDEHERWVRVLCARIVHEVQFWRIPTRTEDG